MVMLVGVVWMLLFFIPFMYLWFTEHFPSMLWKMWGKFENFSILVIQGPDFMLFLPFHMMLLSITVIMAVLLLNFMPRKQWVRRIVSEQKSEVFLVDTLPCLLSRKTLRRWRTPFFFFVLLLGKGRCPGMTSPRRQLTLATKFCMVALHICGLSVCNFIYVTCLPPIILRCL